MFSEGDKFILPLGGVATVVKYVVCKDEYEVFKDGELYARFSGAFLKRLEKTK